MISFICICAGMAKALTADVAYVAQGDVWVTSSSGDQKRQITFDGRNQMPSLSHDGKRLAYLKVRKLIHNERACDLRVADLSTGKSRRAFGGGDTFAYTRQGYESPKSPWSPDDKWIVCSATNSVSLSHGHHDSPCNGDVWIVPAKAGPARRLVRGEVDANRGRQPGFVWSPTGRQLLWWDTDLSGNFFHLVDLHGKDHELQFREIPTGGSVGQLPPIVAWMSPSRLVIALDQTWPSGRQLPEGGTVPDAGISIVDLPGKQISRSRDVYAVAGLSHRLDRAICVEQAPDSTTETWLTDIGGRHIQRLGRRPSRDTEPSPRWSPDDSLIATFRWDSRVEFFNSDGKSLSKRFTAPPRLEVNDIWWAPGGRSLWIECGLRPEFNGYNAFDPNPSLWVMDLKTGRSRQIESGVRSGEISVREPDAGGG